MSKLHYYLTADIEFARITDAAIMPLCGDFGKISKAFWEILDTPNAIADASIPLCLECAGRFVAIPERAEQDVSA
ncbi:hypothetical protein [Paeniglutamicibacter cryotolerans]|uniref:Uncharacterized protein n=1 Tax=Paeniglutamicibacter cryotolerans TaxID=670079 RepID=A0A839QMS2_9MICC|nr:hypothetical protein [Paeniglutamicibacter cryotolerans]MBB2995905.1 hypothetical protein [Paeniglutamicibacter cryotolerans]